MLAVIQKTKYANKCLHLSQLVDHKISHHFDITSFYIFLTVVKKVTLKIQILAQYLAFNGRVSLVNSPWFSGFCYAGPHCNQ